jgi:hypothetical protein
VLIPALVADVFGVRLHRFTDSETGRVYLGFDRLELGRAPALPVANESGA